jgi:hypothetical protein
MSDVINYFFVFKSKQLPPQFTFYIKTFLNTNIILIRENFRMERNYFSQICEIKKTSIDELSRILICAFEKL